ncbi:hypothetical protein [Clostridium rectalis]|uniref:hypothetical protein n=1 Tax=Clostridium rectalis TaxID=2040295 RepID=UPI000F633293|nr:hypothetical protein [Clostridium rectalis]
MIQVFCDQRGSGKTKALIEMANDKVDTSKGHIVYIDDDKRIMFELHREIRFISTCDYTLRSYEGFHGFLCGILASDYDIDTIFIDGLFNVVNLDMQNAAHLFYGLERLNEEYNVDFYISVNEEEEIPECMKKYMDLVCV